MARVTDSLLVVRMFAHMFCNIENISCKVFLFILFFVVFLFFCDLDLLLLIGPLGEFWKLRDSNGYVLNDDGTPSPIVHQWDRFYEELKAFVEEKSMM